MPIYLLKANVGIATKSGDIPSDVWDRQAAEIAVNFDEKIRKDLDESGLMKHVTIMDEPSLVRRLSFDKKYEGAVQEACGYCVVELYTVEKRAEELAVDLWDSEGGE